MASITLILGAPTPENWSNIEDMPDYGKIIFKPKQPISLKEHFLKYLGPVASIEILPEEE